MRKMVRHRIHLIVLLCTALVVGGAFFIHNIVNAASDEFYLYYVNSDNNNRVPLSEFTIENPELVIHLGNNNGIFTSDEITWHVEHTDILDVEEFIGDKTSATITCKKPGKTKVWATIKRNLADGSEQQFSALCMFTVRLAVNDYTNVDGNRGKILHLFDEDAEDCGSLVIDVNESFNFKLKIGAAQARDLSWASLNENIATIQNDGTVTGIQPGIAKIQVQTYDLNNNNNVLQTDYIYVIVKPKFKKLDGNIASTIEISNPTKLETNISDYVTTSEEIEVRTASEFAWIVKDATNNAVLVDTFKGKTSPLVTINPSTTDGSVDIDCKAGKYLVEVYPVYKKDALINVMEAVNYMPGKVKVTEYVEVKELTEYANVLVNDVWDLQKITNIYNIPADFDITVEDCTYSKETRMITFTRTGTAMIRFKLKNGSTLPLDSTFTNGVLTLYVHVGAYTTQNINVSIMKGETKEIRVNDYGYDPSQYGTVYDYSFVSNDTRIVTITSDTPKTANLMGVKEGNTTVDCVISYENGIIRKLTWNVTVWKVITATIDPTEKEIEIDDQFKITATYPSNVNPESDINIQWVNVTNNLATSPIQIVNDEDKDYRGVSIRGMREGKATISLRDLNTGKDLAVCNITVVANTRISFSKTDYNVVLDKVDTSKNFISQELIFTPKMPENPNVVWTSSNTSVATVSSTGIVTYKSAGYTYIKATYYKSAELFVEATYRLNVYQKIDKISLNKTSVVANVKDDILIKAEYSPMEYVLLADQVLTWSTSNDSVVKVSGTTAIPTITAVGPGKATITVTTTSGKKATCSITVIQLPTSVKWADKSITMEVGDKTKLSASLAPINVTDSTLTYESSNPEYLSIDKNGVATAISAGDNGKVTMNVDVVTVNGIRAHLAVTIIQPVTDLTLNYTNRDLAKGSTFTLLPVITPTNAYDKGVTYFTTDSKVATVTSAGVVKGVNGGAVMIGCTSNDSGVTKYCLVIVKEKVSSVTLNKNSYVLGVGKTYKLVATVQSNFASNPTVKWTTSNKKVCTVTSKGVIKGVKIGYATITATSQDGSGQKATCRVRVIRNVTKIKLNKASAQIVEGNSLKLKATITPSNATLKTVSWTSSDETVAYVDSVGKVIAVKEGRCTITATAKDGSGKSASCIIQVIKDNPITGLTIVNKNTTLVVGESQKLSSFVSPKKHTDSVRWYTDDSRIVSINKKTGTIKARRTGIAVVTLATGSGKSATATITVVGLNRTSLSMEQYDTYQLRVVNGKGVNWISSNQSIVNVSTTGKLSARKVGTSYVSALVNGRKIRCKVKVRKIK